MRHDSGARWKAAAERRKFRGKNTRLKQKYGIDIVEFNRMFEQQRGCCAICKVHQSMLTYSLHVDHCHLTGLVRGLLCARCNSGLATFQDNIESMEAAVLYLLRAERVLELRQDLRV